MALFDFALEDLPPLRAQICPAHRRSEPDSILPLCRNAALSAHYLPARQRAAQLIEQMRAQRIHAHGVDALMQEFSLSSQEGVALMCLAEALLRIPDTATADALIRDKLTHSDWRKHLGHSPSLFVNAAAWGLLISGRLVATSSEDSLYGDIANLIAKGGEPLIRRGMDLAVRLLGRQFVAGETIAQALEHAAPFEARGYRYSYDMLGEAALTAQDAQAYCDSYTAAIHVLGAVAARHPERRMDQQPGISIKLSALHPRFLRSQRRAVMQQLLPRLKLLAQLARSYQLGLNIDAEESERLELSLDLFEALALDNDLRNWNGLGFVVQAYQKRAPAVVEWLLDLAQRSRQRLMVRLVKGAYWDSEIKRAQIEGQSDYPVFTRRQHTDVCYLACAEKLLAAGDSIYPQFATHNALTLCTVQAMAQARKRGVDTLEFQCLHGMGEALYDIVLKQADAYPCRIYAPVGSHATLLAYLVRRLLENGANSSFVHQLVDASVPINALLADPVAFTEQSQGQMHPAIALPENLFHAARKNSAGLDLANDAALAAVQQQLNHYATTQWESLPQLASTGMIQLAATPQKIINPANHRDIAGFVTEATTAQVAQAIQIASDAGRAWSTSSVALRAQCLNRLAELLQTQQAELLTLCMREAGKTLPNAIAEVREAIDFCRYYAYQLEHLAQQGVTGTPRGVVVCISPWNFPLAIFTGQIAAALAAGNAVLAKPAEQTPLIAARMVALAHEAGIPAPALQLLPGRGETVGEALIGDARIAAVVFTGSTEVARHINRTIAQHDSEEEVALIAETGGQNAMIVDSSALPEQVVQDVLLSAFDSAGQRCSALRVLCLQEDIADTVIALLKGAMQELRIGDPALLSTDVGPVIDAAAQKQLEEHIAQLTQRGCPVFRCTLTDTENNGTFVAPTLIEIPQLAVLEREVFGPILHVLRYRRDDLPQLLDDINATGYGLTFGVHSRIDETIAACTQRIRAGNIYVNRNMIGAVVGVQPFGGDGLSGTGPKAGGPLYLPRLMKLTPAQQERINQICLAGTYTMPGPTGEENQWTVHPRGTIGCSAATPQEQMQLIDWIIESGNQPMIDEAQARALAETFPTQWPALQQQVGITSALDHADLLTEIDAIVHTGTQSHAKTLRQSLAARDGAIVPLILFDMHQEYSKQPLWRLYTERSISTNTAAAGGNASLMSL